MTNPSKNKSPVWAPNIFGLFPTPVAVATLTERRAAGKVVLCTGGAGTICSVQVAALVELGADAAIVGRRRDVTEAKAAELQSLRAGATVLAISCDVRDSKALEDAVARTVAELGRIDFLM